MAAANFDGNLCSLSVLWSVASTHTFHWCQKFSFLLTSMDQILNPDWKFENEVWSILERKTYFSV